MKSLKLRPLPLSIERWSRHGPSGPKDIIISFASTESGQPPTAFIVSVKPKGLNIPRTRGLDRAYLKDVALTLAGILWPPDSRATTNTKTIATPRDYVIFHGRVYPATDNPPAVGRLSWSDEWDEVEANRAGGTSEFFRDEKSPPRFGWEWARMRGHLDGPWGTYSEGDRTISWTVPLDPAQLPPHLNVTFAAEACPYRAPLRISLQTGLVIPEPHHEALDAKFLRAAENIAQRVLVELDHLQQRPTSPGS